MSPGEVYNEIYAGLQGLSSDSNLMDYLGDARSRHRLQQHREAVSHREQTYDNRGYHRNSDDLGSYPSSPEVDSRPRFSQPSNSGNQQRFFSQYNEEDDDVKFNNLET
jgi:hypothetical protein